MTPGVDAAVAARSGGEGGRRGKSELTDRARAERKLAYTLIAPAAFVMAAVTAYPIGYAIYLSLLRYDLRFPTEKQFVGLDNYVTTLASVDLWWKAFGITVLITTVSLVIELALGMAIALVMHRALFGRGLVRTSVLIPYGIVTVVAAYSWQYAWTPEIGYLASLLPEGSAPLTTMWPAIGIIILAEIWKTTPFMALLLLAGLSLVPEDLLKAARVDGATAWQRFVNVTLPIMKPAILVALLFRTLDAFRIFDNIFILTQGTHDTRSVSILNYDQLFTALNLGIGAAMSVLIFLAVALISFVYIKGFGAAAPGQEVKR